MAPELIGMLLVRTDDGTTVRILETEAYTADDPACHGYNGMTARNATLFGPPGHAYLYFTYGMHWCANVVTGVPGTAGGVLLRAARIETGEEQIRRRRGPRSRRRDLLRGPARLAAGLGLDGEADGVDLLDPDGWLVLKTDRWRPTQIAAGPRVGVSKAADRPWRFWVHEDPEVSDYRRNPRATD